MAFNESLAVYSEPPGVVGTQRQIQISLPQASQDNAPPEILSSPHLPAATREVLLHERSTKRMELEDL